MRHIRNVAVTYCFDPSFLSKKNVTNKVTSYDVCLSLVLCILVDNAGFDEGGKCGEGGGDEGLDVRETIRGGVCDKV